MTGRVWRLLALVLGLQLLGVQASQAAEVTLSARYRGAADGHFENTTPPADYCSEMALACRGADTTTVELPISYTKTTAQGTPDIRDRFFFRLPPRRQVTVSNVASGSTYNVSFEFLAFSQELRRVSGSGTMPVMGGMPQGGCRLRVNTSGPDKARFVWNVSNPASPQACWSELRNESPGTTVTSTVDKTGIQYRLIMPRPIGIPQGTYRGTTQFTVGPGADLDFGNAVSDLNTGILTVNFELEVEHDLYVIWPPGADRAVLEPSGGWQSWLAGRGLPPRLERDLPIRIWSTGPFKVYKRCQYEMKERCGIRDHASPWQVSVEVSLTLPGNIKHANGPARKVTLPTGPLGAPVFEPQEVLINRPGQVHFEISGRRLAALIGNAGSTFSGMVTVVFDADL